MARRIASLLQCRAASARAGRGSRTIVSAVAGYQGSVPGFDSVYGLEILSASEEEVRAQVKVTPDHLQPAGLVHGGVLAAIAEAMTSMATWFAVQDLGQTAQALSNQTSFLRPVTGGTIHRVARRRHRGRTTWVWEVDITDDAGRLCALVRMTVAVREAPREEG